jgi:hypothetical protein
MTDSHNNEGVAVQNVLSDPASNPSPSPEGLQETPHLNNGSICDLDLDKRDPDMLELEEIPEEECIYWRQPGLTVHPINLALLGQGLLHLHVLLSTPPEQPVTFYWPSTRKILSHQL